MIFIQVLGPDGTDLAVWNGLVLELVLHVDTDGSCPTNWY